MGESLTLTLPGAGLVQSLLIKQQRDELDEIGRAVGTPVVYLKAAWADPVLYGGRGERTGCDVDALVSPDAFAPFAEALLARGFVRHEHPSPSYERYFGHKEWSFRAPAGAMPVDLHRALTEPVWYDLPTADLIARAVFWESVDGPILSLGAEDQLLYAAAHYANHFYDLDAKHLEDCQKLVAKHRIDGRALWRRARAAHLSLPLALLLEALAARGSEVRGADDDPHSAWLGLRKRLAERWVTTRPGLQRRRPRSRGVDYLLLSPLLSDRASALPRIALMYGLPWLSEKLARRWRG